MRLLGTAGCWFLLDVVFYANSLFSSTVLTVFGVGNTAPTVPEQLADVALWNVYLALMALPVRRCHGFSLRSLSNTGYRCSSSRPDRKPSDLTGIF